MNRLAATPCAGSTQAACDGRVVRARSHHDGSNPTGRAAIGGPGRSMSTDRRRRCSSSASRSVRTETESAAPDSAPRRCRVCTSDPRPMRSIGVWAVQTIRTSSRRRRSPPTAPMRWSSCNQTVPPTARADAGRCATASERRRWPVHQSSRCSTRPVRPYSAGQSVRFAKPSSAFRSSRGPIRSMNSSVSTSRVGGVGAPDESSPSQAVAPPRLASTGATARTRPPGARVQPSSVDQVTGNR